MSAVTEVLRLGLDRCPPPLAAYAALCDGGRMHGTALLESATEGHAGTRRSLLALAPALRISLGDEVVHVAACSANGRAAIARLGGDGDALSIPVPRARTEPLRDENERLRGPCVFDALRHVLRGLAPVRAADRTRLALVGAMSFELAERFDDVPPNGAGTTPGFTFVVPELSLDIDHVGGRAELVAVAFDDAARRDLGRALERVAGTLAALPREDDVPEPLATLVEEPVTDCDDATFAAHVEAARAAIRAGDAYQVVVSRAWHVACADPLAAYRRLRARNPSPYLFYLADDAGTLFGASPESALRHDAATRTLTVYPVAGTRARGTDPDDDARVEAALRHDPKELAEHMMLVDLARNDVARVCEPGSRTVPLLLGVDRYRHVMHLVSRVEGRLREDLDALHALRACLNMGTLSGAPKLRATELIRALERGPRGFYGGAVGMLDAAGNLDTAITIRAAHVRDGVACVRAGAGVVYASDPQAEADETRQKARAVLTAIAS